MLGQTIEVNYADNRVITAHTALNVNLNVIYSATGKKVYYIALLMVRLFAWPFV